MPTPSDMIDTPPGLVEPGNIDLNRRKPYVGPFGEVSTVRSMSVGFGRTEFLIPTITEDGRVMTEREAIDTFVRTRQHLGAFRSVKAANEYARKLHDAQGKQYDAPAKGRREDPAKDGTNRSAQGMLTSPTDAYTRQP